jgi:hypothetical protein
MLRSRAAVGKSRRFALRNRENRGWLQSLNVETPILLIANNVTGGRIGEMATDDQNLFIAKALEHGFARLHALLLVHIEIAGTVSFSKLERMVQHIAGNKAFLSL